MDKPRIKGVLYFRMRFELEILDGTNKGKRIMLRNGLVIGRTQDDLAFDDAEMSSSHAIVSYGFKKAWNIECLAPAKLRLGFEEVARASLILGLIFHLGQTGFKVVERATGVVGAWDEQLKDWFDNFPARQTSTEIFFFIHPVRLSFIQGPQFEEAYTLSYGPRLLGYNSLDLNIKDPAAPAHIAKFFQIGDRAYIENLCGDRSTINGSAYDQHMVSPGDILRVASNIIELSILT